MARTRRGNGAGTYYLLDMGGEKYGDSILCDFGASRILIDGGHARDYRGQPGFQSIPDQLKSILGDPPFKVSLLVVTHCHADHIGCLPDLVKQGLLKPEIALLADEKMGFGRDGGATGEDATLPDAVRKVVAALREEDRSDLQGAELDQFLEDAGRLEDRYKEMISTLQDGGTKVVRYQGVDTADDVLQHFAGIGMEILGPTKEHLEICAEAIAALTKDAVERVSDALRFDAQLSPAVIYRQIVSNAGRLSDALDRPGKGAALNDQSIVIKFKGADGDVLLTGDMQFAKPEIRGLDPLMRALRQVVKENGPYKFVKLAHHSSYNGLDESVYKDFGEPPYVAHTGGRRDPDHPDHGSLDFLEGLGDSISFARTDRNSLIAFSLDKGFTISKGELNDFSQNSRSDIEGTLASPAGPTGGFVSPASPLQSSAGTARSIDLLFAKVPFETGRVNLGGFIVEIERPERGPVRVGASGAPSAESTKPPQSGSGDPRPVLSGLKLAQGRALPNLLFATCSKRLEANIGRDECAAALKLIRDAGQTFVDVPDQDENPIGSVVVELKKNQYRGVVVVGGYDVMPSQRVDVLTPDLRTRIGGQVSDEPDLFMVWSDEGYGDNDGDLVPEVPVTRIPDGRLANLMLTSLSAGSPLQGGRYGIRNSQRPFADVVWANIGGAEQLLISGPTLAADVRTADVSRPSVYMMLHGSDSDGTRFWGEDQTGVVEAINVKRVPKNGVGIVFSGCCWGALTVDETASQRAAGLTPRIPEQSMALSFLLGGSLAFVGCTGAHYSPDNGAGFFGGPMHQAFWAQVLHGQKAPAEALFEAKRDFLRNMPHGRRKAFDIGIERKIYKEFCCLGLGW